ncbi:MAG: site-specific DNA-methyltransferase [Planctomycetaceae bacterium]|jgi:DNA modification methylase|nr:site-specific DNA-methyltransferase [Planctomycetaceae bacterium]
MSQENWKETDINVDSLWIISERDKTGKHSNIYHGNFIPQIPNQLLRRYTKERDVVLDIFTGSGTTLFECEKLNRRFIGFDINTTIIDFVKSQMVGSSVLYRISECDVADKKLFDSAMNDSLSFMETGNVQFVIAHLPYMDIVKFTDKPEDLSHITDLATFVKKFVDIMNNVLPYLENGRHFGIILGDVYKKSEVIPLAFYVLDSIKRHFRAKLKGIVIKNIEGNRGKLGTANIWKYRALKNDYFLFKHEYILIFKKEG